MATFPGWEQAVLERIHAPVTVQNVLFLRAWQSKEGGSARNNPLNTTQPATGATVLPGNSAGVKEYPSAAVGADATASTLLNGRYPDVVKALQTGNAPAALVSGKVSVDAVVSQIRTWGTVHFADMIAQQSKGAGSGLASAIGGAAKHVPGVQQGVDAVNAVGDVAGGAVDAAQAVGGFVATITNPHNILRAGEVLAGAGLVAMGSFLLARQIGLGAPIGGAIGAAIGGPAGAIAGANIADKPQTDPVEEAFAKGQEQGLAAAARSAGRQEGRKAYRRAQPSSQNDPQYEGGIPF